VTVEFRKTGLIKAFAEKAIDLIETTPIEIPFGALVLGLALGTYGYDVNIEKESRRPVAFSEVGKTVQAFEREEKGAVPPLTKFYAATNDMIMRIFEASNEALSRNDSNETFARELEFKTDRAFKFHRQLGQDAAEIPKAAQEALKSVQKLVDVTNNIPPVIRDFANTWDESHVDEYHTEYHTTSVCDTENKCHDETTSEEVYDDTIHTYTYSAKNSLNAAKELELFLQKFPDVAIQEKIILSVKTDVENEYAIEKSMKEVLKGKIPTPEQSLHFSNIWATNSNFTTYHPQAVVNHATLQGLSPQWRQATGTAHSIRKVTYSQSDSGPAEYQLAKHTLSVAQALNTASQKIVGGMQFAGGNAPVLESKVKEFIAVTLDGKKGDADQIRDDLMSVTINTYKNNFETGLDVEPFKWGDVFGYTFAGILAGGAIGWGADYLGNRKKNGSGGNGFKPRF
jgi:hypothetical protein